MYLQIFLLFKTLDRSSWPARIAESRSTYASLRSHYLRGIEYPDELGSAVDPLSEHEEVHMPSITYHVAY